MIPVVGIMHLPVTFILQPRIDIGNGRMESASLATSILRRFCELRPVSRISPVSTISSIPSTIMAFKKPRKSSKRIIQRDTHDADGPSARRESVIPHNYYEAGPSGVVFTDRVLHVEVRDSPRPTKLPRLQSPPRGEALSEPSNPFIISDMDEMPSNSPPTVAIADAHATPPVDCVIPSQAPLSDTARGSPLSVQEAMLPHSIPQPTPSGPVVPPAEATCPPDPQNPQDTRGSEKKKKKVSSTGNTWTELLTFRHRDLPMRSWMKLVSTYPTYCSIFWPERHTPRYLDNVSAVTSHRRRTGVEIAQNHRPYVDAASVPLTEITHFTGLKNGLNHNRMKPSGVSRSATSLNWALCTHWDIKDRNVLRSPLALLICTTWSLPM